MEIQVLWMRLSFFFFFFNEMKGPRRCFDPPGGPHIEVRTLININLSIGAAYVQGRGAHSAPRGWDLVGFQDLPRLLISAKKKNTLNQSSYHLHVWPKILKMYGPFEWVQLW